MVTRHRVLILMLFFAFTCSGTVLAQERTASPSLQQAIAAGQVHIQFHGTGGSSGDTVMAEVSKGPQAKSGRDTGGTFRIPPGSELESSDSGAQNMVILGVAGRVTGHGTYAPQTQITVPATGAATYLLRAFCTQFHKNNPSSATSFTLGRPNAVLTCIGRQSRAASLSVPATQAAIWMYSDRITFEEVNSEFQVSSMEWAEAQRVFAACSTSAQ
jgi:hypothetical protein